MPAAILAKGGSVVDTTTRVCLAVGLLFADAIDVDDDYTRSVVVL